MKHVPVITLMLAGVAVLAALFPHSGGSLEWSRQATGASHAWRMVTGHFVHFGWSHLIWDATAFILLGSMAESLFCSNETDALTKRTSTPRVEISAARKSHGKPGPNRSQLGRSSCFVAFIAGVALCLSMAVLWLQPHLASYRGLSGIDSALFGFIAQRLIKHGRSRPNGPLIGLGSLLLIAFLAKCGYELATRQLTFARADATLPFEPVPLVHGLGLLLGMGFGLITAPRDQDNSVTGLGLSKDNTSSSEQADAHDAKFPMITNLTINPPKGRST
ncbi:MAG: hypothetical protein KBA71_02260 [Opitutaceae bacterium]|nr:hypothetical protein [Opitutaceae bacterium]